MLFLWCAITGEFSSDWFASRELAEAYAADLGNEWRIVELSDAQQMEIFK
jgi:hypothetical protein